VVGFFDVGILVDFCRTQVLHVQKYAYVVGNPAINFYCKIAKKVKLFAQFAHHTYTQKTWSSKKMMTWSWLSLLQMFWWTFEMV